MPTNDKPSDVWCSRCPKPSVRMVGDDAMCADCAGMALWKANSPSWKGAPKMAAAR